MKRKVWFILPAITLILSGCAMLQSVIKSTFPYTTNLEIPRSSAVGVEISVTGMANSFDQDFKKDGNNADKVSEVRMESARVESREPHDFNIGNLTSLKVFMSKVDGTDEVLVASRTDITAGLGNVMILDIDNTHQLEKMVRQEKVRIRMVYKLRNHINVDAHLHIVLGLGAVPSRN
ncbi:hypothetical protein [Mucilaginibacter gotjawali]|uniref:Late embryogenesis abundant protein n=1 Tax=Mucilaginibacter gotjawali TaxID=1550579 RepID=A0A839SE36_9SPHI|nr:hypothetical protein [Mucilaginibacter gotjawali]MBB3054807.1 hypothetical protein [Mucilaginibacter gotjawali]